MLDSEGRGQRDARALHLAGHALICRLLYGERVIKRVRIDDDARGLLFSTYSRLPLPEICRPAPGESKRSTPLCVEAIVDAHGVLSYGGMAAEALDRGDVATAAEWMAHERARLDREGLAKTAGLVGRERPAEQFFAAYWDEAMRLLCARRSALNRLADAIAKQRCVNGDRVDTLLAERL